MIDFSLHSYKCMVQCIYIYIYILTLNLLLWNGRDDNTRKETRKPSMQPFKMLKAAHNRCACRLGNVLYEQKKRGDMLKFMKREEKVKGRWGVSGGEGEEHTYLITDFIHYELLYAREFAMCEYFTDVVSLSWSSAGA